MGYQWVNEELVDPYFNPLEPEVILYASDKYGNLKMVGVEYIVINVGQGWPHFGDHPFDENGVPPLMNEDPPVPHWSLHVWLYESNPNGMFTPFNPNVFCRRQWSMGNSIWIKAYHQIRNGQVDPVDGPG